VHAKTALTEPVHRQFRQQSGSREGSGQDKARSRVLRSGSDLVLAAALALRLIVIDLGVFVGRVDLPLRVICSGTASAAPAAWTYGSAGG
jgi:hypothetical protein